MIDTRLKTLVSILLSSKLVSLIEKDIKSKYILTTEEIIVY